MSGLQGAYLRVMVTTLILVIVLILLWVAGWRYHYGSDGTCVVLRRVLGLVFARRVERIVERALEVNADRGGSGAWVAGLTGVRYG